MTRQSALAALIHEDHRQTLALLNELDERVRGPMSRRPLDPGMADDGTLIENLRRGVDRDILRHFAIEETLLFPMIQDVLGLDLVLMLTREHEAVGSLASALLIAAEPATSRPLTASEWAAFRESAEAFIDQEIFHIQKEEASVVQCLATLLGRAEDDRAAARFRDLASLPAAP